MFSSFLKYRKEYRSVSKPVREGHWVSQGFWEAVTSFFKEYLIEFPRADIIYLDFQ